MKKAKKPATSRAAKKASLTKKKSAPVKAAKKAAPKAAAKKAAPKAAAKKLAKKVEPKAKKALATVKKAVGKVEKVVAKALAPKAPKEKEAKQAKVKPEKEPKAKKTAEPVKAIEPEAPAQEEIYEEAEVYLTDAEGRRYCRVKDCDQIAMVDAYCRYHYLLFWKKIQVRKEILTEGKLERYIEDLTARYPDKYLEMLRKDLRTEKDFTAAIAELEIDESGVDSEYEDEAQSYLDEVRGHTGEGASERDEEGF
jgi:hypothetical protein